MSLKEKRHFNLKPLITEREEDLSADFSGLTLPSTERTGKDCWEEQHNKFGCSETNWTCPKKTPERKLEVDNLFHPFSSSPSPLPQVDNTSLSGLVDYPDSPRPTGTSLFNDNLSVKKRDCNKGASSWANQRRRKQFVAPSSKQNSEALGKDVKRKPSLRARLINRFILSTRKAVHEYAAAATAIISPSGDMLRCTHGAKEFTDVVDNRQGSSFCGYEDKKESYDASFIEKTAGNLVGVESRVRSKSFPEYFIPHNDSIQEENMAFSRIRSCSQVLDDDMYRPKLNDCLYVSEGQTSFNVTNDCMNGTREFSPVSPYNYRRTRTEGNEQDGGDDDADEDGIETFYAEGDEKNESTENQAGGEEDIHQTPKYKKKMNLKLDLETVKGSSSGNARIVAVKLNRKKSSFL